MFLLMIVFLLFILETNCGAGVSDIKIIARYGTYLLFVSHYVQFFHNKYHIGTY